MAAGKAPGPDGLIPDLLKISPTVSADIVHPLLFKWAATKSEPMMAKGSIATDLYKGSGSHALMPKYRSIILGSFIPKAHHGFLRGRLMALGTCLFRDSQAGGRSGGLCEIPILQMRSFSKLIKARAKSAGIGFFDVKDAYYSAIRHLLAASLAIEGDSEYLTIGMDMVHTLVQASQMLLDSPGILDDWSREDSEKTHLVELLAEAHAGAWFVVRGAEGIARPRKGTRPGDPLADVLFSVIVAPILQEIEHELGSLGILMSPQPQEHLFSDEGEIGFLSDGTFADDTCFALALPNNCPDDAFTLLADSVTIIDRAFRKRLLMPNYSPGKSALVVQTGGRYSQALKRHLLLDQESCIPIWGSDHKISIVFDYKHLGTLAAANASLGMEIAHRASRHASAYAPLRKTLVKRGLQTKAKLTYIDSFATGLLHTHAGAWEALSGSQAAKLDSLQLHSYRQAAGQIWSPKKNTVTNTEIFEKSKRVPVSALVSIDRFFFFGGWQITPPMSSGRLSIAHSAWMVLGLLRWGTT